MGRVSGTLTDVPVRTTSARRPCATGPDRLERVVHDRTGSRPTMYGLRYPPTVRRGSTSRWLAPSWASTCSAPGWPAPALPFAGSCSTRRATASLGPRHLLTW